MLRKQLPFYGKRGSIGEINETDNYYQVKTYNIDGTYNNITNIRKTYQGKIQLLHNYYKDVEEYLNKNKEKMKELSNKNSKVLLNKNIAKIILLVSIILGLLPLATSIILNDATLWTIGEITLLIGASFSTASIISLKNIKENQSMETFKQTYYNLEHDWKVYKLEEQELTKNNFQRKLAKRSVTPVSHTDNYNDPYVKTKKMEDNTSSNQAA